MHPILKIAEEFLLNEVAPSANDIDADPQALRQALDGLCKLNLMAMRRPNDYGGPDLDESEFRLFQESVARYSGSLAFLQTQHQSAVSMITKGDNNDLKERTLPQMHNGSLLVGIGFSQLRRPGPPILTATPTESGYVLNGEVPWVTGHTFFHQFLIGAALPDGSAVFGLVPFQNKKQPTGGIIQFSGPMRLAAMESPQTMSATLENWILDPADTAFTKPPGWIQNNDMINVTLQAWFALGCARAGIDIMESAYQKRKAPFIQAAAKKLSTELEACRHQAQNQELPQADRLKVRSWAIDLAARCSHAGVVCSSGAANSVHHAAQRVYREALVYTVSAQTQDIMEASLQRLVARGGLG